MFRFWDITTLEVNSQKEWSDLTIHAIEIGIFIMHYGVIFCKKCVEAIIEIKVGRYSLKVIGKSSVNLVHFSISISFFGINVCLKICWISSAAAALLNETYLAQIICTY